MTRYIVTDTEIQDAIHNAIKTQDRNPEGYDYVITNSMNVVEDVLKRLDKYKVAEPEQTENPKQDSRREIDTIEHPVIRIGDIARNELVAMICEAYRNGLAD